MSSISQVRRKNEKKRLREFIVNLELYIKEGRRIVLKKEPTPAMVIEGDKRGINIFDFYHETMSTTEQEIRRRRTNEYQREQNKKEAIKNHGVYKGTGEQIISRTQKQEEYFAMSKEDQLAAHKAKQETRDVINGYLCPSCKGIIPFNDIADLDAEGQIDYCIVNKATANKGIAKFTFHIDCYASYLLKRYRTVHQVNTTANMIESYMNWGKK